MFVFIHGDGVRPVVEHHVAFITPAAHLEGQAVPASWIDTQNRPKEFQVVFTHGRAEVTDEIGKYMIKTGLAQKSGASLFKPSSGW